jgi:predicted helicase
MFGVKKKRVGKDAADKPLATIYQADLYGKRASKFATLNASNIESIDWNELPVDADVWKVEGKGKMEYMQGFSVAELFPVNTVGVVTSRDKFVIADSKTELAKRLEDFLALDVVQAKYTYELRENKSWTVAQAQKHQYDPSNIVPISYRPFDNRFIYYHNDFIERSRESVMTNFINTQNLSLVFRRQQPSENDLYVYCSNRMIADGYIRSDNKGSETCAPLYLYENGEKIANLDPAIVAQIEAVVGATTPEDILDYVYAYLHAPSYRAQFGEFLKTDFPRVPLPASKELFSNLVGHGRHLRGLHLLTDPAVRQPITAFPNTGSDVVEKLSYKNGRVYINDEQYWDGVPEAVWKFYIGGYQPAQKYLKDRKGQKLSNSEMENYEQMIVSLHETFKVMASIDKELEL